MVLAVIAGVSGAVLFLASSVQKLRAPRSHALKLRQVGVPARWMTLGLAAATGWEISLLALFSLLAIQIAAIAAAITVLVYSFIFREGDCNCLPGPRALNRWPRQRNVALACVFALEAAFITSSSSPAALEVALGIGVLAGTIAFGWSLMRFQSLSFPVMEDRS